MSAPPASTSGTPPAPSSASKRRVADYIAESLAQQGVTAVYGGHGGSVIPLVNALASHDKLRWVYTRNEQAASLAASAEAKLTGRLAVCVATSGPGASHLTTGLIDALQDRVPVLAITGMKATRAVDLSEFQAIHQEELFRAAGLPFSKVVMSEDAVPAMLRNAIAVAMREKTAVHLAIPADLQARQVVLDPTHRELSHIPYLEYQSSDTRIHKAARVLQDPALRIVIAIGHLAATELPESTPEFPHHMGSAYLRLAETLNAPVITQLDAKGIVDESHPLCYGVLGIFGNPGLDAARSLVQCADVVLLFGVDHQAVDLISDSNFNQVRKVVEFEPDAGSAAYHRWYNCEEVVLGELAGNARRLEAAVANLRSTVAMREAAKAIEDSRPLNAQARQWNWLLRGGWREAATVPVSPTPKAKFDPEGTDAYLPSRFQVDHVEREGFCHPARVLAPIGRMLRPGDVACVDVGDVTLWSSLCMCLSGGQRVLSSQGMGVMGYALPAAIAASIQRPDQHVVAIAGDGGSQMTIGELATAVQLKCRFTMVIFVNGILGRVHFGFEGVSGDDIVSPDFVALARAYGGDGVHVTSPEEAQAAVRTAWGRKGAGFFLIEVRTDPELKAEYAKMRDDGPFLTQLREALADVLPTDLRPSDVRKLIAFDVHGGGMLSADELSAARDVLSRLRASGDPQDLLRVLRTGQLFKSPMLTSVKTLLAPLDPSPFEVRAGPGGGAGAEIHVVGSVAHVLAGHVPERLRNARIDAAPYRAGFETGAVEGMDGLGEMCLADGVAFVRETNAARDDYFCTRSADAFLTTAAVLVPKEAKADCEVTMDRVIAPEGVPFVRTINDLYAEIKAPFVFCGHIYWSRCDVTCISKAPSTEEVVADHITSYYRQPGAVLHDVKTFVCGAVAQDELERSDLGREIFSRIFYHDLTKNTGKAGAGEITASIGCESQVQCHVHLVTYSASGNSLADVWHLNPESVVQSLDLQVFKVASLKVLDEQ